MSIKKLFESTEKNKNYLTENTDQTAFKDVESGRNVKEIREKQEHFLPQIDYSEPEKFARFGSAVLYYKSAFTRILDYYPYDGSDAEMNKFYNGCLDIEKYLIDNKYPRTNGYITFNLAGYGTTSITDGYGRPANYEYIDFKGGPGTGSVTTTSLKSLSINPYSDLMDNANIYDTDLYKNDNLPSDYAKGTRTSNLRANFDDGVTVEFWFKSGSISTSDTHKQVLFDWWNNNDASISDYGRITLELTSALGSAGDRLNPFCVTVNSGTSDARNVLLLGSSSLWNDMGSWHHYAFRLKNSGSTLGAQLYVDGKAHDERSYEKYNLSGAYGPAIASYQSSDNLQGWWKLQNPTTLADSSTHGRDGSVAGVSNRPSISSNRPAMGIQTFTSTFDGDATANTGDTAVNIGTADTWDDIIGNDTANGSTQLMTLAGWVYKTGDGEGDYGRIMDFGAGDIKWFTGTTERVYFTAKWNGTEVRWQTGAGMFPLNEWTHIAVTYNATDPSNTPKIYVNGIERSVSLSTSAPSAPYSGIAGDDCFIGNNSNTLRTWQGQLADIAVWNSILTAKEIRTIYQAYFFQEKISSSGITSLGPKGAVGRIGALLTNPAGTAAGAGGGKLAGSLDEFRYWKTARSARDIGLNYFTQVRGGANTDISNTTLGVYYKFNEGITGNDSVDSSVLDYAGRVTNGVWTGYTAGARNIGSAMVSASVASKEYKDPIIRPMHPEVTALRSELVASGAFHDGNNNSSFLSLLPGWIVDEEEVGKESDLQNMCHIMGAYFDTLYLQISQIPKLKHLAYTSASHKPIPFAEHLPQSLGLYSPELFIDASVMEKFLNRDQTNLFEGDLHDVKNLIYSNIYNNLTSIYKAKGTEKAIKNIFRCFNVDEKLLRLTINSNREEYTLHTNTQQTLINKNCANFNTASNAEATIYQKSSSLSGWPSRGYITGSPRLNPYGFTMEANIIFPYFNVHNDNDFDRRFVTSSLFGATTVLDRGGVPAPDPAVDTNKKGTDTTFPNNRTGVTNADVANFQVSFVRDEPQGKSGYFVLESKYGGAGGTPPFPTLTSSTFLDVYDNELWNISVRIRPDTYPLAGFVEGDAGEVYPYVVEFHGVNTIGTTVANSFSVAGTMTNTEGQTYNQAGKRIYVGALRNNLTGTTINKSDVLVSSVKYWTKYLEDSTLLQHAIDVENIGISGSFLPLSPLDSNSKSIINADTLALNWNFMTITSSEGTSADSSGNFSVLDFSSGSMTTASIAAGGPTPGIGKGWIGPVTRIQHPGYGYGFQANASNIVDRKAVNSYRFINPEHVVSEDMIRIFDDEDRMYPPTEFIPNFIYSIEKSPSNAISEEMLDFFAGVVDFNALIGAPVNRYRERYKEMEHLREIFFRRVGEVKATEKYLEYYRWFDDALSTLIGQMVPASSEYVDDILNVVENTVLDRPKYKSRFPSLEFFEPDVGGFVEGRKAQSYPPRLGRSTEPSSPRKTTEHEFFWKNRALRNAPEITSGDPTIDAQREKLRKTIISVPTLSASFPTLSASSGRYVAYEYRTRALSRIYEATAVSQSLYHGGVNFNKDKNLGFARASVWPAGPINNEMGVFVPENVLVAFPDDYIKTTNFKEVDSGPEQLRTIHRVYKVNSGRDWQSGEGYYNMKSTVAFPFSIVSASVSGGYVDHIHTEVTANIDITNLHNDTYGPNYEKPLQGPFTEDVVGGLQSRHQPINFNATDTWHDRPEQFKILLGSCIGPPGAIGVVGPDYPWPEANNPGDRPYPITGSRKAYLFRDMTAKRPLNFKNILRTTSSQQGNYSQQYEVMNSFGTYTNPRHFIDNQPPLPSGAYTGSTRYATQMRTYLDVHRNSEGHRQLLPDYSIAYLTGTKNQSIVTTRFSNPGDIKTMGIGYRDIRGNEYSVYNAWNYRNIEYLRISQMPSGTISEATGAATTGIRLFDIHGKDIGEIAHRARHCGKFGRDSAYVKENMGYGLTASFAAPRIGADRGPIYVGLSGIYNYTSTMASSLQGWWRLNRNISEAGQCIDSSGNNRHGTFASLAQRPSFSTSLYPSGQVQTGSCTFDGGGSADDRTSVGTAATWDAIIGNDTAGGSTEKMTLAAWVYKTGDGENSWGRIMDFGQGDIKWYTGGDERIYFSAKWNGNNIVQWRSPASAFSLNTWAHIVVTYDATASANIPKIYVNGTEVSVTLDTGTQTGAYYGLVNQDAFIGNNHNNDRTWEGQLADVAIWNSILTPDAIKAIYHSGLTGNTNPNGPGASYDQLPARYKIHRNTKNVIRIANERIVSYNKNNITNKYGIQFGTGSYTPLIRMGKLYHSGTFTKNGDLVTGNTWTLATWLRYRTPTTSNISAILTLGDNGLNTLNDCVLAWYLDNAKKMKLYAQGTDGVGNTKGQWVGDTALSADTWYHVALTYDGSDTANAPIFYINGSAITNASNPSSPSAVLASVNSVGSGKSYIAGTNRGESAGNFMPHKNLDLDEMAIYDSVLTADEISTLYSNGSILNLTSSTAPKTGSLVTWMRFGDVANDPTTTAAVASLTGGYGPIFYDQMGNNEYIMYGESQTTVSKMSMISEGSTAGNPISVAYISGTREQTIYDTTRKRFDNYNVYRPIPQSDIQYRWLARSVTDPASSKYFGYQRTRGSGRAYFSSSQEGVVPFWTFVSASEVQPTSGILGGGYQPIARLGTVALDAVSSSTNTLGFPPDAGSQAYVNGALNVTTNLPSASYLNTLLSRRQATYGWTWQMWRTAQYHPVLIDEMKNSVLSVVTGNTDSVTEFRLPPVSLKGRTSRVNYDAAYANPLQYSAGSRNNITLIGGHTNEKIFFNEVELDNMAARNVNNIYTPLDFAIETVRNGQHFAGNWIIYRQNVFPSTRNEFTTRSTTRPGYENGFWRNSPANRVALGADQWNSFGVGNPNNPVTTKGISQSAWPLDPPVTFLTRSGPPNFQVSGGIHLSYARNRGFAGELQNVWQYSQGDYYTGMPQSYIARNPIRTCQFILSPIYARKHMLGSPRSVVAPSGIDVPETGTVPSFDQCIYPNRYPSGAFGIAEFRLVSASQAYSGEALWEAPRNAGITRRVGREAKYLVSASNPWFNDYDAFNADLKLMAKGFSTVPEYRISDHMEDYLKFGPHDPGNIDTFNMPGCGISSATASFYKDYSNSDFMKDVLKIQKKTLMDINEIKLTCEATIRFNPYKGFYPVQRTLDLVSQFSRSYGPGLYAIMPQNAAGNLPFPGFGASGSVIFTASLGNVQWIGAQFRPLVAPLFAPGILYNSIKSGMAVDYPVVTDPETMIRLPYGSNSTVTPPPKSSGLSPDNWALSTIDNNFNRAFSSRFSGSYFDYRMPFEAIIEPDRHIDNRFFIDMEPHPSASLLATASWSGHADDVYTKMSSNFFGEVGNFFLRDKDFTNLESRVVPNNLRFSSGEVYGARLVLKRSMNGPRSYAHESGTLGTSNPFTNRGGKTFAAFLTESNPGDEFAVGEWVDEAPGYPLPQDPKRNIDYRENFTMYSRPTAFGPPCSGRFFASTAGLTGSAGQSGSMDCFDGYNWAYTPPYYHGEAWVDFIFRPSASVNYDLEKILAETEAVYHRVDPGPPTGALPYFYEFPLIPGGVGGANMHGVGQGPGNPYCGNFVNINAMQLNASFNLFGIERVFKQSGRGKGLQTNEAVGAKWIIQPKFETPMMNFGDTTIHPNTSGSGNLTIPLYGSASVPRGMWHQFGQIPTDPSKGIFLSIGEIPENWLNNHWLVINSGSVYNNYTVSATDPKRFQKGREYKSLAKLFGFDKTNSKIRLGELAESQEIREAVVAVPYILDRPYSSNLQQSPPLGSNEITTIKKFFTIPREFINKVKANKNDPTVGKSIKNLVQKMDGYVMPPQFDFLSDDRIDPMVMYMFEFKYKLDKNDLSYIWQNLAPRDYQKVRFQKTSVAHEVFDTELLNIDNLTNHPDLRWMVFKVKQKSQVEYWDLIQDQIGEATDQIWGDNKKKQRGYKLSYNWPYDFVSFVESIKLDVELMYKHPNNTNIKQTPTDKKKVAKKKAQRRAQNKAQGPNRRRKKK